MSNIRGPLKGDIAVYRGYIGFELSQSKGYLLEVHITNEAYSIWGLSWSPHPILGNYHISLARHAVLTPQPYT